MKRLNDFVSTVTAEDVKYFVDKALLETDVEQKDKLLKQALLLLDAIEVYEITREPVTGFSVAGWDFISCPHDYRCTMSSTNGNNESVCSKCGHLIRW